MENGKGIKTEDPEIDQYRVDFTSPPDPDDPKCWPDTTKWIVTGVLSATGLNRIMVSTIMAPALTNIASSLSMNNEESVMSMSVYLLATAFGPLIIGPLSEVYGRSPVLHGTNIWFLIWNIVCGFSNSKGLLIASRLLAGFGASAIYALAGGVLSDIWPAEQRGRSLGLYILIPMLGAAIGPIIGGFITEATTWRWIFWSTSVLQGLMVVASLFAFRETYAPTILHRKAKRLRKSTGDSRYYTQFERDFNSRSAVWILQKSLTRPMRLLAFHPIIQIQACLSGFNYGILYIMLSTFADLWTSQYEESISISGLHYISICLGEVVGAFVSGHVIDTIFRRLKDKAKGAAAPEYRVPVMIPSAILAPTGLLIYGWTAYSHSHWLVVDIGAAILAFGMTFGGQALQAYVIDSYPDHASSASAATQFLRSLTAFGFPLFAPAMYTTMGYGWGNTFLACLYIVIGILGPLILWFYGPKLRQKASSF
ncbi:major facilitator superfamily domain-containing protein [Talaromyces proteolyticus]|uniref:Major facilitator superfamily domain-containing protein n=1 Tax=Talaromyces proteolyticus TaxID=1131652 RepID=A0AAD4KZY3_9EURO|nr:major facilitator superfamily domain-containing protein [Talaromyces proteolyticus]KAH8701546.1 major facilitator superfamily domain-containing protein [Talaromyces proteolyticus]